MQEWHTVKKVNRKKIIVTPLHKKMRATFSKKYIFSPVTLTIGEMLSHLVHTDLWLIETSFYNLN